MPHDSALPDRARVIADTLRFLSGGWLADDLDAQWAGDVADEIVHCDFNGLGYHVACCPLCQEVSCDPDCPLAPLRVGSVRW